MRVGRRKIESRSQVGPTSKTVAPQMIRDDQGLYSCQFIVE